MDWTGCNSLYFSHSFPPRPGSEEMLSAVEKEVLKVEMSSADRLLQLKLGPKKESSYDEFWLGGRIDKTSL